MERELVGSALGYLTSSGKTAMMYRPEDTEINGLVWSPPGGKEKKNERPSVCLEREFLEEGGITILNPRLRGIAIFDNQNRTYLGKPIKRDYKVFIFEASKYGDPKSLAEEKRWIGPEGDQLEWFDYKEMETLKMDEPGRRIWRWNHTFNKEKVYKARFTFDGEKIAKVIFS
jgi:ADP-ribose pyrophosphatase YjhB (NUDIX family)